MQISLKMGTLFDWRGAIKKHVGGTIRRSASGNFTLSVFQYSLQLSGGLCDKNLIDRSSLPAVFSVSKVLDGHRLLIDRSKYLFII